jgi:ABC-2 type transport system permease protein
MGPIISGYTASYLYALACLSVTCAVSAITRSQVVCFIVSVAFCIVIALIGDPGVTQTIVSTTPDWAEGFVRFVSYFSFMDHFFELTKGIFVMRDVLYFLSVIVVSLIITHLALRAKRA